ncbi:MAG: translation elongation factor Ts [Deltaproteobacteria bacterium]|nr:translation elongation factor Ts [Deltaproteobacteria bacterium]MCL5878233.1 translation elongation factor Ts [Deltaproteobacteria bacterium]
MAEVTAEMVKTLREKTGAGIMECKSALNEAGGNFDKAVDILRKKGIASASKKIGRTAIEGVIEAYIHAGSKIGVMVEINCETDFVARTQDFKIFAKDIAMQIAAANPLYVDRESVPAAIVEKEKEIYAEQSKTSGKPAPVIEKMVQGKLEKFYKEVCLLEQSYIRDPNVVIGDLLKSMIAKVGENIIIRRFARFQIGETAKS